MNLKLLASASAFALAAALSTGAMVQATDPGSTTTTDSFNDNSNNSTNDSNNDNSNNSDNSDRSVSTTTMSTQDLAGSVSGITVNYGTPGGGEGGGDQNGTLTTGAINAGGAAFAGVQPPRGGGPGSVRLSP